MPRPAEPESVDKRRSRLLAELRDEQVELVRDRDHPQGGFTDVEELMRVLLDEVLYARHPIIHERRRTSYGCVIMEPAAFDARIGRTEHVSIIELSGTRGQRDLSAGRALADGLTTFLVRSSRGAEALISLTSADEATVVQLVQELRCYAIQRTPAGAVKAYGDDRVYTYDLDEWTVKQFASTRTLELCQYLGVAVPFYDVASALLEFCLHLLSARHIGTSLVWFLRNPGDESVRLSNPGSAPAAALNVKIASHRRSLATLLSGTDGACFIDGDGTVSLVGVHLAWSERAAELVAPESGTRHTSGKRFSFDVAQVVVLVVSQDGPVTIYSDGVGILHLRAIGSYAASLKRMVPEKAEDIDSWVSEVTCRRCAKRLRVEVTDVVGWRDWETADCPVCGASEEIRVRGFAVTAIPLKPWDSAREFL